jgi:hypothetical protein
MPSILRSTHLKPFRTLYRSPTELRGWCLSADALIQICCAKRSPLQSDNHSDLRVHRLLVSLLELLLEPVKKSFEADEEAGKLDRAEEIVGRGTPSQRASGAAIESRRRSARRAAPAADPAQYFETVD